MVKPHRKLILLFCFLAVFSAIAQDMVTPPDNLLREFRNTSGSEARFEIFFNAEDRYAENSAYDWLDALNVFANNAAANQDSVAMRHYKLMQAQAYFDLGDYEKSEAFAQDLYNENENLERDHMEILLNLLDINYERLGLYAKQVEVRQQKRDRGFTENITFYDIYSNLGLHRKAMKYYIDEEKAKIAEDDWYGQAVYNNNIGNYLRLDRSPSTAISWLSKAEGFVNVFLNDKSRAKTDEQINKAHLLHGIIEANLGKCHVQLNQHEEAIGHLEKGLSSIKEYKGENYSTEEIECTLALAESHIQLGNYSLATDLLSAPLELSKIQYQRKRNRLYALFYEKTGDFENATRYLKRNTRIADSLDLTYNALQKQQLAVVAGRDIANEKRKLDQQKLLNEQIRRNMEAQEGKTNLVFISLIFTLLGFAGLVYAYLKSIKNQRLIAEQNHIIEASLVEKDSLLKEIHHRVKNNLQMVSSLLSLQTKNTRSKAAIEALEEGKSRVKAMALIHQKLYQNDDLSVIEMQGYIESLVNSVQSVFKKGGHNINITIDAEGVELDIDRAIPFGLILNELVSNSFKYAFPDDKENGKIYIHLRKNGDQGFFEYMDNGVGLPEDTEERTQSSMGIRLMNRLVNQLQSTLNIDKTADGVRFWFNFK
ncbi:sensor histidine kinase [Lentiprolixibacter aurantiacus]|uniref:histidine kinase n=1 Tax=Lentiprolixibacter aurantiacus TaxID=2993939 RepID=A0AAE3ML74_9FLAO|nr:histidine kinase dimerization/phosphoacceptor domain -containing protein [Lentiprolixibacter aurantiacus]MCX2719443.1 ATP-binding protein [Lentiprolixibacter aurantiacus]